MKRSRIEELKQQIRDATGEQPVFATMPDWSPETEETFLEEVLAYHKAGPPLVRQELQQAGASLPPPDALNDAELPVRLWELIGELAVLAIVLEFSDHLSDRQLYGYLWGWLFEEDTLRMQPPGHVLHLDVVSSRSPHGAYNFLKYYADDRLRQRFARDFPFVPLPEHVDPPYKRDHLLPGHEERLPV